MPIVNVLMGLFVGVVLLWLVIARTSGSRRGKP